MREEALQIADELMAKYDLLSVKASMVIRELIRELDKKIEGEKS